ncbi:MAG: hypothetical protein KJ000_14370 [Pirellulaceae bacterium]|nr:hypothetical protein [Pirellulaceae bacterium]
MAANILFAACLVATSTLGQNLSQTVIDQQNENFRKSWNTDLIWTFDQLPTEGTVPEYRVPYSGNIYLDRQGGTVDALRKYDQTFHAGDLKATRHEQWDTTAYQKTYYRTRRVGLFGSTSVPVRATPHWHGHCNGWSAASIRHAEPQNPVVRDGVTFTPADIKGLLAELYMYQDTLNIGGEYGEVHAAELHVALANWIGRFSHPIAMEADPGKEKWNYPVYGYASSFHRQGNRVEVRTNIRYAYFSEKELDKSPRLSKTKYFHYQLNLNQNGDIVGGSYYRDSTRIDLLWLPIAPVSPGLKGNERGNPHVDVDKVLAIWRESVPDELVAKWIRFHDAHDVPGEQSAPETLVAGNDPATEEMPSERPSGEPSSEPRNENVPVSPPSPLLNNSLLGTAETDVDR